MVKIYADANGEITAVRLTPAEETLMPITKAQAVSILEFDQVTNPGILEAYSKDHNGHRLIGGVLSCRRVPYAIVADGEDESVRKIAQQSVSDLTVYVGLANPTNAQNVLVLKTLARAVSYLIRKQFL